MYGIQTILKIIYPTVCGFCDRIYPDTICPKCLLEVEKYKENHIHNYSDSYFLRHYYLYRYEGIVREKMIQYKFNDKPYLYETFVNLVLKDKKICGFLKSYDIIIPVPISKKRKQQRGYNQSQLVARGIAKNIEKLEVVTDVLMKKQDNNAQSSLDKQERRKNVKGTYEIRKKQKIENKKIVLFDDIFTTGSTVEECSLVLKQAGAKEVAVLTLAKD